MSASAPTGGAIEGSPAGGAFPAVANVGRLLLVVPPVGKAYRAEASLLIEAAGAGVGLKAPQFEGIDPAIFGSCDQLRPCPTADPIGARMEQSHFFAVAREKRDDSAVVFGSDQLAIFENYIGDEPAILRHGVEHRQEGQQPERLEEHL